MQMTFSKYYMFNDHKGPFTNTCKGGPDAKNIYRENFSGSPFRPQKISGPPIWPWKLGVNPIEKHVNSILMENVG